MEKMRVRNVIVSDLEKFKYSLIKELTEKQINYVQIDNEFNFDGNIYRFYSDNILSSEDVSSMIFDVSLLELNPVQNEDTLLDNKKSVPIYNKRKLKEQNKKTLCKVKRR